MWHIKDRKAVFTQSRLQEEIEEFKVKNFVFNQVFPLSPRRLLVVYHLPGPELDLFHEFFVARQKETLLYLQCTPQLSEPLFDLQKDQFLVLTKTPSDRLQKEALHSNNEKIVRALLHFVQETAD